jgi:cell division protein FtsL
MTPTDFERAIKKDIRNNPIVREIDQDRQLELWRSAGIGVFLVAVVLFSAWQHFELLRHGYEIEQMQQERAHELEVNRHLRLEIETLKAPRRIEQIATERLNLVAPTADDAIVLESFPPPLPATQVMAARGLGSDDTAATDPTLEPRADTDANADSLP